MSVPSAPPPYAPPPSRPPTGAGPSRTPWIVLAVVVLLVIIGTGSAVAVRALLERQDAASPSAGDSARTGTGSGAVKPTAAAPTSFKGGPTAQWTVTPSDFLDGRDGRFVDARPFGYDSDESGAVALYTEDSLVIGVELADADSPPGVVIGLDPESGHEQWRFEYDASNGYAMCFDLSSKHLVACLAGGEMRVVDPRKGVVSDPISSSATYVVDGPDDAVYSIAYEAVMPPDDSYPNGLGTIHVDRGTIDDLTSQWSQDYEGDASHHFDGNLIAAAGPDQLGLDLEGFALLVDAGTGEEVRRESYDAGAGDPEPNHLDVRDAVLTQVNSNNNERPGVLVLSDEDSNLVAIAPDGSSTYWSRPLPSDPYDIDGRSSIGIAGASVVYSTETLIEGWTGFGSGGAATPQDVTQYRTPCGKEPDITTKSATAADGSVDVVLVFHAVCPDGQWVDGQAVALTFTGADGSVVGRGSYDFSGSPVWLPGASGGDDTGPSVEATVTLPPGALFALPDEIQGQVTTIIIACEHSAGSDGDDSAPKSGSSTQAASYAPYAPDAEEESADNDAALATLQRIAAADAPAAAALEGLWVPQLSSKKDGTTDEVDQHTYDYADILAEHLRLRLEYPDALLLFSSDWKSFLAPEYWVTVVGTPSPGYPEANQFCADQGFPYSHCYAKRILRDGPSDGATKHRDD